MKIAIQILLSFITIFTIGCRSNSKKNLSGADINTSIDSNTIMVRPEIVNVELSKISDSTEKFAEPVVTHVVIHTMQGYGQDTIFAKAAASLLEKVINTFEFKQMVLSQSYAFNQGLNSQQIYDRIMDARELDGPGGTDKVIDLRLRTITLEEDGQRWVNRCKPGSSAGTIGIDGAGTGIAAVCSDWLRMTAVQKHPAWLAAHFIHEYMHILNFTHPSNRDQSVPYKIHSIVEQLGEKYNN